MSICNLQYLLRSVDGHGLREYERIAGKESNRSVAIALDLGITKGAVLISLEERMGVENVQGTGQ